MKLPNWVPIKDARILSLLAGSFLQVYAGIKIGITLISLPVLLSGAIAAQIETSSEIARQVLQFLPVLIIGQLFVEVGFLLYMGASLMGFAFREADT